MKMGGWRREVGSSRDIEKLLELAV